ncbi:24906_t:CDS:2 [Entrophospora sp. SA101]|nr:24906_t:CDS:2 [Entrophospora sp. SA101]CAJ0830340.1 1830_t:CDS:2 [Entrophospora sp. SA101]
MNKLKHSKRYREISQKIEPNKRYSLNETLKFLQENNQERQEKIIIIGEELPPTLQNKEEIELVSAGKVAQLVNKEKKMIILTHTSYQDKIKPLAKILGPKGIFPNSKNGTLTDDLEKAVKEIQQGRIEIKTDKQGNIHILLGKASFSLEQLKKNYEIAYETIKSLKPTN